MSNLRSLPLSGFAPTNADIAKHLREQAEAVENGHFGDLRTCLLVYDTADGRLMRQTCGEVCDLARAMGLLFMAIAQSSTQEDP